MSFLQSDHPLTSAFFFFPDNFYELHVLSRVNEALVPQQICFFFLLSTKERVNEEQLEDLKKEMWTSGFKHSWEKAVVEYRARYRTAP